MTTKLDLQNIEEKYEDICRERDEIRFGRNPQKEEAFFNDREKLEWLILGATQRHLISAKLNPPIFAIKSESPDFFTYADEIKSKEQKADAVRNRFPDKPFFYEVARPLKAPFETLREGIVKKAQKPYASSTVLMAYHNISYTDRTYDVPFPEHILSEHKTNPFLKVESFQHVLVLNADLNDLIELYPHPYLLSSFPSPL